MKINKRIMFLFLAFIMLIIGAVTDTFLFKQKTFLGYFVTCLWEFGLFMCGVAFAPVYYKWFGDKKSK